MVATVRAFSSREQIANAPADAAFVRESRTLGSTAPALRWRDTRDDLVRRAAMWRAAFEAAGIQRGDRIVLRLPTHWAVGSDCLLCLADLGVLWTSACEASEVRAFEPIALVTTPADALHLAQVLDGAESVLRLVFVTGEPGGSIASTRRAIEERLGARCVDVYAMTELGVLGWSCAGSPGGVHLHEDAFEVESESDGELVMSTRAQRDVMLLGYRTGDLVQLSRAACTCGSGWARAEGGILGRTTDRLTVRGVALLPSQIEDVVRRHPAIRDFALKLYRKVELAVQLEPDSAIATEGDRARVAAEVSEDLKRSLGVRLQCDVLPPGSLSDQDAGRRARRFSRQ